MSISDVIQNFTQLVDQQKKDLEDTKQEIIDLTASRREMAENNDAALASFDERIGAMEDRLDKWESDIKTMFERMEETRASAERSWQTLDATVKSINAGVKTEPARDQQLDELLDILKRDRA